MWTKGRSLQAILDIALPKDSKWHDIQLTNSELYIDGKLIARRTLTDWEEVDEEFMIFDRSLTREEILSLQQTLTLDSYLDPRENHNIISSLRTIIDDIWNEGYQACTNEKVDSDKWVGRILSVIDSD